MVQTGRKRSQGIFFCYKSKTLPGMKMCLRLIESNKKAGGVLWKRKWETIKKKIWNDLKRLK